MSAASPTRNRCSAGLPALCAASTAARDDIAASLAAEATEEMAEATSEAAATPTPPAPASPILSALDQAALNAREKLQRAEAAWHEDWDGSVEAIAAVLDAIELPAASTEVTDEAVTAAMEADSETQEQGEEGNEEEVQCLHSGKMRPENGISTGPDNQARCWPSKTTPSGPPGAWN